MTDEEDSEHTLPITPRDPPEQPPWLSTVTSYVIELTYHDVNDIVMGRQNIVAMIDDANDGKLLTTDTAMPVTTEQPLEYD